MAGLELWFINSSRPQLEKTAFLHPLLQSKQEAYRGKSGGAFPSANSFQWSPAVRSLSLLLLLNAAWRRRAADPDPVSAPRLVGAEGTAAASLDYALGKLPLWLLDMFGMDARGNALARRLVRRSNPERRHGGECALALNLCMLPAEKIKIYLDGQPILDAPALDQMATSIMAQCDQRGPSAAASPGAAGKAPQAPVRLNEFKSANAGEAKLPAAAAPQDGLRYRAMLLGGAAAADAVCRFAAAHAHCPLPEPFDCPAQMEWWRGVMRAELDLVMRDTEIFNRTRYRQTVQALCTEPAFLSRSGGKGQIASEIDLGLSYSGRLGLQGESAAMRRALEDCLPLRASLAGGQAGALAIFGFMKLMRGYDITLDYNRASACELVPHCSCSDFAQDFDLCVLSLPAAAAVLGRDVQSPFQPLMLLPKTTHRVVASMSRAAALPCLDSGRYVFMQSTPSGAAMYFERLVQAGLIKAAGAAVSDMELDEISALLEQGDPEVRAILGFPFYGFHQAWNHCAFVGHETYRLGAQETVLFVHERILNNQAAARALAAAVRSAWMDLCEQAAARELMADILIEDRGLMKVLKRASGISVGVLRGAGVRDDEKSSKTSINAREAEIS